MKWLQQRKIVITGEGYYAPPTLLMEKGTERRQDVGLLAPEPEIRLPGAVRGGAERPSYHQLAS